MFRLQASHLPEDPKFNADLADLGFFINKAGQFRMIQYPDKDFNFHYSNDERVNEVRREAYQICQRNEVMKRLSNLGIQKLYLPQLSYTKPKDQAFVPILAPPAEVLKTRKRVIVLVNDSLQDLGILAYRRLQRELGVNGGSVVNFIKELYSRSFVRDDHSKIFQDDQGISVKEETPGFIVMNCGQLLFSHKFSEAKTVRSWNAMPRKSAYHEPTAIVDENIVPGNRDAKQHIQFVIENVIKKKDFVAEDAEVYVIAIENGAENLLEVLDSDLEEYGSRFTAMAIIDSHVQGIQIKNPDLKAFLHQRAREWRHEAYINNPRECVDLPRNYSKEVQKLEADNGHKASASTIGIDAPQHISWLETTKSQSPSSVTGVLYSLTNRLKNLALASIPDGAASKETDQKTAGGALDVTSLDDEDVLSLKDPICPTFADAENPFAAGECIFTSPLVQHCVLEFFEEVARNPMHYHNPDFQVGQPEAEDTDFQPLPADMVSPEQSEINDKKEKLEGMKASLRDTSADKEELKAGRKNLEKRIAATEEEIDELTRKALATGSLGAGEAKETRRKWGTVGGGPKVKFAGAMVDSEILKAAGMDDVVDEGLEAQVEKQLEGLEDKAE